MTETSFHRRNKKIRQGRVVSRKAEKTGVVLVERIVQHPLYKRKVKVSKKLMYHDETNESQSGDMVRIIECKPISKCKRWRLFDVVKATQPVGMNEQ